MWRMGVPVATPAHFGDVLAGVAALARRDVSPDLADAIRTTYGRSVIGAVSSGRAALYLILQAMKSCEGRDEVIVPAFICPSVPRAVVKAGLKPVLCDVEPAGFGLDPLALERIVGRRTLAVVVAHLFGCPVPVAPIIDRARAAGAMVIEDAAQALGARIGGQWAGTAADAGVVSFGISKVISSGGGLILATHDAVAERLRDLLKQLPLPRLHTQAAGLAKFAALALLVRSHCLGPLATIWAGAFRGKDDDRDFPVCAQSRLQVATGRRLYARLDEITAARRRNAEWYSESFASLPGIRLPQVREGTMPVWLRYPIVIGDPGLRGSLLAVLRRAGVNVSEMYDAESYRLVCRMAERPLPCPTTEYLMRRMAGLPTHTYVTANDRMRTLEGFRAVLPGSETRF